MEITEFTKEERDYIDSTLGSIDWENLKKEFKDIVKNNGLIPEKMFLSYQQGIYTSSEVSEILAKSFRINGRIYLELIRDCLSNNLSLASSIRNYISKKANKLLEDPVIFKELGRGHVEFLNKEIEKYLYRNKEIGDPLKEMMLGVDYELDVNQKIRPFVLLLAKNYLIGEGWNEDELKSFLEIMNMNPQLDEDSLRYSLELKKIEGVEDSFLLEIKFNEFYTFDSGLMKNEKFYTKLNKIVEHYCEDDYDNVGLTFEYAYSGELKIKDKGIYFEGNLLQNEEKNKINLKKIIFEKLKIHFKDCLIEEKSLDEKIIQALESRDEKSLKNLMETKIFLESLSNISTILAEVIEDISTESEVITTSMSKPLFNFVNAFRGRIFNQNDNKNLYRPR